MVMAVATLYDAPDDATGWWLERATLSFASLTFTAAVAAAPQQKQGNEPVLLERRLIRPALLLRRSITVL